VCVCETWKLYIVKNNCVVFDCIQFPSLYRNQGTSPSWHCTLCFTFEAWLSSLAVGSHICTLRIFYKNYTIIQTRYICVPLISISQRAAPEQMILLALLYSVGRDSSVGVATCYGMDGSGIESRWGARFSAPVHTGPGAHPASYAMDTGSFPGVKRPEHGVDHPPLLVPKLKKEYSYISGAWR